jgi:hypothetical protein
LLLKTAGQDRSCDFQPKSWQLFSGIRWQKLTTPWRQITRQWEQTTRQS